MKNVLILVSIIYCLGCDFNNENSVSDNRNIKENDVDTISPDLPLFDFVNFEMNLNKANPLFSGYMVNNFDSLNLEIEDRKSGTKITFVRSVNKKLPVINISAEKNSKIIYSIGKFNKFYLCDSLIILIHEQAVNLVTVHVFDKYLQPIELYNVLYNDENNEHFVEIMEYAVPNAGNKYCCKYEHIKTEVVDFNKVKSPEIYLILRKHIHILPDGCVKEITFRDVGNNFPLWMLFQEHI